MAGAVSLPFIPVSSCFPRLEQTYKTATWSNSDLRMLLSRHMEKKPIDDTVPLSFTHEPISIKLNFKPYRLIENGFIFISSFLFKKCDDNNDDVIIKLLNKIRRDSDILLLSNHSHI